MDVSHIWIANSPINSTKRKEEEIDDFGSKISKFSKIGVNEFGVRTVRITNLIKSTVESRAWIQAVKPASYLYLYLNLMHLFYIFYIPIRPNRVRTHHKLCLTRRVCFRQGAGNASVRAWSTGRWSAGNEWRKVGAYPLGIGPPTDEGWARGVERRGQQKSE